MSYGFQVQAKDNVLTVIGQTNEVPDGKYSVNGHEDPAEQSISVARYAPADALGVTPLLSQATSWERRTDPLAPAAAAVPAEDSLAGG